MTLHEKIVSLYPEIGALSLREFDMYITLQDDSDGRGEYIAKWEHPTLPEPTAEQLA